MRNVQKVEEIREEIGRRSFSREKCLEEAEGELPRVWRLLHLL